MQLADQRAQDHVAQQQADDRRHECAERDIGLCADSDQAQDRHDREECCACEAAPQLELASYRADDQDSDNNHGEQYRFVGEAEGLLAEVDQRRGEQVDDQFTDGVYWGATGRDYPSRKPGDSEACQAGDGSSEPCPPSGGAGRVPLVAPVHLPILRWCWPPDNELVLTH